MKGNIMNKNILKQSGLIALVLIALLAVISWGSYAYADDVDEIRQNSHEVQVDPQLLAEMNENGRAGYLIYFKDKADLSPAYEMDWEARGHFVVDTLRETAALSQRNVRAYLDHEGIAYRHFWIDNIVAVESSNINVLNGLLIFSEIDAIQAKADMFLIEPEGRVNEAVPMALDTLLAPEPNLVQVKAPDVWALGIRGQGTVIANIDSGVRYTHNALVNQYRGNLGGGSFDHNFNWLDPDGGTVAPTDTNGHGTHVMGTMVGYDGGANEIGVAPESEWIACRGCPPTGCSQAGLLACAEWVAAPYAIGNPGSADPDLRPNAVNNSWGNCQQTYNNWYQGLVDAWHAAGIIPVFANGNSSNCGYSSPPGLNTVGNPARYGNVTGVGSSGTSNGQYAPHSNWGPTDNPDTVNPQPGWADLKPQVIAPGVTIRSSVISSDSAYASTGWTGTSMSAPHVTGMIALMWQAAPCLIGDYATTETIIEQTATPIMYDDLGSGPRSPNYATGWGEINVLDAVQQAQSMCGLSGSIEGTVTEAGSGTPLAGASIEATLNMTTTLTATSDGQGDYLIGFAPVGTYEMTASAFGYLPTTVSNVEVISGSVTIQDFALTPVPSAVVDGTVTDVNTGWPLYARIDVDGVSGSPFWTDPATGYYSITLPEGSTYDFTVSAFVAGYLPEMVTVGPLMGDTTVDVALDVNAATCIAPGYLPGDSDFYDFEADDGGFVGTVDWEWGTNYNWNGGACDGNNYPPPGAFSGVGMWATVLNDCHANTGTFSILSFEADLTSQSSAILKWWDWYDVFETFDYGEVYVNNTLVYDRASSYIIPTAWEQHQVDLTPFLGGVVDIEFRMFATTVVNRAGWYIDDVLVGEPSCTPQAGNLVVGNVYDENTNDGLSGAMVVNDSGYTATAQATPDDPDVDDGFYTLFAPEGSNVLTATHILAYGSDTVTIVVGDGDTVAQNFWLPAGWLQADPDVLVVNVLTGTITTVPWHLHNLGGVAADFRIRERDGGYSPLAAIAGQSWSYSQPAAIGPASVRSAEGQAALAADGGGIAWTGAESLPTGDGVVRYGHAQCANDPDSFYVISGVNEAFNVTNKVWRYDAANDEWTPLANIPTGQEGISATCYEGYIYAVGGGGTNQFYIYDIAADDWAPGPALSRDVWGAAVGAYDGYLYMIGGDNNFSFGGVSDQVNIYDINAGDWIGTGTPMPTAAVTAGFAQAGEYLYIVGGWGNASPGQNVDQTQRYEMSSDNWETGPTFSSARADLPLALTGSHLYAMGGDAPGGGAFDATSLVEKLDHTAWPGGSWVATTSLPGPLTAHKGGFCTEAVAGGEVWSVGGFTGGAIVGTTQYEAAEDCFVDTIPWLSEDPTEGTVGANSTEVIDLTFDATVPEVDALGIYTGTLRIHNNTPYGPITVPVTMRVIETYDLWLPIIVKP
jgi:subtilisin family serine protease